MSCRNWLVDLPWMFCPGKKKTCITVCVCVRAPCQLSSEYRTAIAMQINSKSLTIMVKC